MGSRRRGAPPCYFPSGVLLRFVGSGLYVDSNMVADSHVCVCFLLKLLRIATPDYAHRFMYIASPIPVPTQVMSSGCDNIITSSVRSVSYVFVLLFYIGQFSVCPLEFIHMAHGHRLVTLSLMSLQAYKYCESRCSDPRTEFPLTMANFTVVDRTSYSDFIRLVFYDGGFPLLALLSR